MLRAFLSSKGGGHSILCFSSYQVDDSLEVAKVGKPSGLALHGGVLFWGEGKYWIGDGVEGVFKPLVQW